VTFDHNTSFDGGTACGGLQLSAMPYTSYAGMDWHIGSGTAAASYVPGTTQDETIATDIKGSARSTPTDAGAYKAR
jgi:hypothetical protein